MIHAIYLKVNQAWAVFFGKNLSTATRISIDDQYSFKSYSDLEYACRICGLKLIRKHALIADITA